MPIFQCLIDPGLVKGSRNIYQNKLSIFIGELTQLVRTINRKIHALKLIKNVNKGTIELPQN